MSGGRDKRLDDFAAVLRWFKGSGHDVIVIGGMAVCEDVVLTAFEVRPGREGVDFVRRWAAVEKWDQLPEPFFAELLSLATETTAAGRRFLAAESLSFDVGEALLGTAPAEEHSTLLAILRKRFGD